MDETPLDGMFAVCNWPDTKEVLLIRPGLKHWPEDVRSPDEIVSRPEFYVLNTAKATAWPLFEHTNLDVWLQLKHRPLQPTSEKGVFWAALPNRQREETVVGRFCKNEFQPDVLFRFPLIFGSNDMWADEDAMRIYVAHKGDLLCFPLMQSK